MNDDESSGMILMGPLGYGVELTKEQAMCVNFKGDKTSLVVKGAAGSGKSLVLMGRATSILKKEYELGKKNGIIVFSHTNSLTNYAKEYLDPNDQKKEYVKVCTLERYISDIAQTMSHLPNYPKGSKISYEKRCEIIKQLLIERGKVRKHRFYKFNNTSNTINKNVDFWSSEFEWMLGLGITIEDRDLYLSTPRKGRSHTYNMKIDDRFEAFDLYCNYLSVLSKKHLTEWGLVQIFLEKHASEIPDEYKYDYVFIDEAQDLSITCMHIAIAISKKEVFIAMDANQRIYNNHWLMKDLGIPNTSRYLKKSFRCTKQIDAFAEALRKINEKYLDKDDLCRHIVPEAEGSKPLIIEFNSYDEQQHAIISLIRHYLSDPRTRTALILRSRKEISQWSELLSSEGVYHEKIQGKNHHWFLKYKKFEDDDDEYDDYEEVFASDTYSTRKPGLKLCTIHSAKGLEFHNVIIPSFNRNKYPPKFRAEGTEFTSREDHEAKWRNLAYVAMTRAKINLVISFYKNPSNYIDEIFDVSSASVLLEETYGDSDDLFDYIHYDDFIAGFDNFVSENYVIDLNAPVERNSVTTKVTDSPSIIVGEYVEVDEHDEYKKSLDKNNFENSFCLAKNGDVECMYEVAEFLNQGKGVQQNREEAIIWYREAAKKDHAAAQRMYGLSLLDGIYVEKDIPLGIDQIRQSAENNDVKSQNLLANFYYDGQYVPYDLESSIYWHSIAANGGNLESQWFMVKYYKDKIVDKSTDGVGNYFYWAELAASNNHLEAQYDLANYLRSFYDEPEDSIKWYKESANNGHMKAQFELSECYFEGYGVDKDVELAIYWLKKSAKSGYPVAEYKLSQFYKKGIYVESDFDLYKRYLKKSAEHNYPDAVAELTHLETNELNNNEACKLYTRNFKFLEDSPVLTDPNRFFNLFLTYADLGYSGAQLNLAICYYLGVGTDQNYDLFIHWLEKSSEQNYPEALYVEANVFYKAEIPDYMGAYLRLLKAAFLGHERAKFMLATAYYQIGKKGFSENKPMAFLLLSELSTSGFEKSFFEYAWMLEMGSGLNAQDKSHAKYWYQKVTFEEHIEKAKIALKRLHNVEASSELSSIPIQVLPEKNPIFDPDLDKKLKSSITLTDFCKKLIETKTSMEKSVLHSSFSLKSNSYNYSDRVSERRHVVGKEVSKKQEDVMDIIKKYDIKYRDNRATGGTVWVYGERDIIKLLSELKQNGYNFTPAAKNVPKDGQKIWYKL